MNIAALEHHLDLKFITKSFFFCAAIVPLLIPLNFMSVWVWPHKPVPTPVAPEFISSKAYESLATYDEVLKKSSLFGYSSGEANLPVFKSSITELMKDYRLKGIVTMGEPEAIIEDARTQKTSFLKAGDTLNELAVKEIKDEEVVLSYYGEEKGLRIQ